MPVRLDSLPPHLMARVELGIDDCWHWTGMRGMNGRARYGPRNASCVVWEAVVGEIPAGCHLHHARCRNILCVNPEHLEPISPGAHQRLHAAEVTHCPLGHEYDVANTYVDPLGRRQCRACRALRERRRRRERREAKQRSAA